MDASLPWWAHKTVLWLFFTVVFGVFYVIAYSVALGIRDNYYRYAQKASLQWTGSKPPRRPTVLRGVWFLLGAALTAWLVVDRLIY